MFFWLQLNPVSVMIFCILQTHNRKRKNLIKWNFKLAPLPSVVVAQRPVQDWWTLDPCCPGHRNTPGPSGHAPPMAHPRGPSYEVLYHTGNTAHCLLDLQTIKQTVLHININYEMFHPINTEHVTYTQVAQLDNISRNICLIYEWKHVNKWLN